MVLVYLRRLAAAYQIDRFQHGIYTHGKQLVEIDRAQRVVRSDGDGLLQQDRPFIEPVIGPEYA